MILSEGFFNLNYTNPRKDRTKTPSLGEREETAALLEHDDETYIVYFVHN